MSQGFKRFCRLTHLLILAVAVAGGCSKSESPEPEPSAPVESAPAPKVVDNRPNAATEYVRIKKSMSEDFLDPLIDVSYNEPPDQEASAYLQSKQSVIKEIIAASKLDRCDFGVDYASATRPDMSHLSSVRRCIQLLSFDATRLIQFPSGETQAVERLAAMARVANHAAADQTLIGKLVAYACCQLTAECINEFRTKLIRPESRRLLQAELTKVRDGDIFDMKPAWSNELAMTRNLVRSGSVPMPDGTLTFNESEKAEVIRELERVYGEIQKAWDQPSAQDAIGRILASVRHPKAEQFLESLDSMRRHTDRAVSSLNAAIASTKP